MILESGFVVQSGSINGVLPEPPSTPVRGGVAAGPGAGSGRDAGWCQRRPGARVRKTSVAMRMPSVVASQRFPSLLMVAASCQPPIR